MFSQRARERLSGWGVKMYLDTCIHSVDAGHVTLASRPLKPGESVDVLLCEFSPEKQRVINADVLIWTGGIRPPAALAAWNLGVDERGRLPVNVFGEVLGRTNVYAVGDCASLKNPKTNQAVPALGQAAVIEGRVVAENIAAACAKRATRMRYAFPYLHALVPVGAKYALADVYGITFAGLFGWLVRQFANLNYFRSVLSVRDALRVWFRGARLYTRND